MITVFSLFGNRFAKFFHLPGQPVRRSRDSGTLSSRRPDSHRLPKPAVPGKEIRNESGTGLFRLTGPDVDDILPTWVFSSLLLMNTGESGAVWPDSWGACFVRKAVLVSLDAFYDADFQYLQPYGGLTGILREGSFCRQVKTVFPALTYPAHVTIVTGCDPDRTEVGQNQPYQPDVPSEQRVWYWERKHIAVPTLFDAVRAAGGKSCSILWPVCCKNPAARWCFPEVHPLPGENIVLKTLRYGSPLFILDSERRFGALRQGIREPGLSNYAAAIAERIIRKKKPDLTALHLIDLDEMRHHHGTHSPEAGEAVRRNEDRLKALRKAMEETPGMEDALLIAVSDHGQSDISRTVNLTECLNTVGLADDFGVQSNGESAYFFAKREGADIEKALGRLQGCLDEFGIQRLYSPSDLRQMHAVSGPAFACEAADQVVFSDGLDQNKREKATHGFGPGRPAENCLFAVLGKGIRAGYEMPSMPMRDVAPTIAGLMGITLSEASGRDHSSELLVRP